MAARSGSRGDRAEALETGSRDLCQVRRALSKDIFLSTFQKVHLNAAYFGGTRLDRFSRYQFGLFDDTRIHGVPGVRRPLRRPRHGPRLVFV